MRKLVLAGLVAGLGGIAAPAVQAEDAGNLAMATSVMNQGATRAVSGRPGMPGAGAASHGAWGTRVNGRWSAGSNAPGGWNSYRRPASGFTLPSYWINPSYYIADYRGYGLPAPAYGYGWSRYYDDAVLTDRYGRVSDVRYGYDWDRFGGYDDGYYDDRGYDDRGYDNRGYGNPRPAGNNGVAGAVVGGVVGGVAGNLIAGKGNRLPGTIIGAGVGAIAGAAIGSSSGRNRDERSYAPPIPYEGNTGYPAPYYGAPRGGEPYPYSDNAPSLNSRPVGYDGQWVGTWYGNDGRVYSGTYDGQYDGKVKGKYRKQSASAYPQPAYRTAPLPPQGYGYGYNSYGYDASAYGASGYSSYESYDYVAPTVTTTTVTTEETTYATVKKAVRKPVVRKARPKPRIVCCPCGC